jgi:hypothetical protein
MGFDLHDRAVQAIAKQRFSYPDKEKPDWKTWVNTKEEKTMGVKANGNPVYPDIVVTDKENKAIIAGEIETEDTIDEDEAKQWHQYSDLCGTCYVYVPVGCENRTKELIQGEKFSISGIRTYRFDASKVIVTNV